MAAAPSPARRVVPHVLGPPLPALPALWAAAGRRAVSAALCVAGPLAVGVALGRADLGSAAALGGFTAIYGHALPFRRRAVVVAGVGAVIVLASGLGALAATDPVALSLVCGLLAAAATAGTAVWRVGPPGPLGVVLVGGSASALGTASGQLGEHLLATVAGVLLAWVVCMLPWLWDPTGPERRVVAAAEAAVALAERGGLGTSRPGAVARAVRVADDAVASASRRGDGSLRVRLEDLEQRFFRALPLGDDDRGARRLEQVARPLPRRRPPAWVATTVRIGAGVTAAGLMATALGLQSPYWAATTAVAVLLGTDARHTRARAVHRVTGTLIGVALAALLLWADPPVGVTVLVIALLQLAVELLVAHQYVLAVAFITPLALLLVHVGVPERSGAELVATRLGETAVGIALALAAGLLLLPRAGSRRLPAAVTAATARVLAAADASPGGPADRALRDALVAVDEVATAARAEMSPARGTSAWLRRSRRVGDLGWALLGARARGEHELAGRVVASVHADLGRR